ncbi:NAD(P)H-flavin reductase [Aliidiomarina celeris]|uniref:NAD(P)H-flavin reductase n=1 Tax=Aliidiomarina celeris TaxID=2249428 RepID=UPI000DEB0EAE|nr:NAD(P)H-flavin reductase [Aliidiomarina celeris]
MTKTTLNCHVQQIEPLTPFVYRVLLRPEKALAFIPGQYVCVVMNNGDLRPFSIASTPEAPELELHIGATPENPYAWEVLQKLKANTTIEISTPQGTAGLTDSERDILVIAGGTGFSYAWSIIRSHLNSASSRKVTLFWGAKTLGDLYWHTQLSELATKDERFQYQPVVEQAPENWQGHQGLVHKVALAETADLTQHDVYIAGRFEMVRVARDDFFANKLPETQLFGDALSYI